MAKAQDKLGLRRFMEGMILSKLVATQMMYQLCMGEVMSMDKWALGLVIK